MHLFVGAADTNRPMEKIVAKRERCIARVGNGKKAR